MDKWPGDVNDLSKGSEQVRADDQSCLLVYTYLCTIHGTLSMRYLNLTWARKPPGWLSSAGGASAHIQEKSCTYMSVTDRASWFLVSFVRFPRKRGRGRYIRARHNVDSICFCILLCYEHLHRQSPDPGILPYSVRPEPSVFSKFAVRFQVKDRAWVGREI
jgi:hypothetical protein